MTARNIDFDLREWRSANGYSQETLAQIFGVTTSTVVRWERTARIRPLVQLALERLEEKPAL